MLILGAFPIYAQSEDPSPIVDWQKRLTSEERLTALGSDLMGDSIDPNLGSLTFEHTDISLPGNNGLDVSIRRRLSQGYKYDAGVNVEFGDWELVVPKITAIALDGSGFGWAGRRCNGDWEENFPLESGGSAGNWAGNPISDGGGSTYYEVRRHDYMNGVSVTIPGQGSQTILRDGDMTPVSYTHLTLPTKA